MKTTCNPINLSYRFQAEGIGPIPCREAADPSVVPYKGRLWLFASKLGGYWSTADLIDWTFHQSTNLPVEDYAPDVRVIDDWLVVTVSRLEVACPIFRSQDPADDDAWEEISAPFPYWDPNLYQDEDKRVYLYWGCSDVEPIYGIEMDRKTLLPIGEKKILFGQEHHTHGWERKSEYNRVSYPPHIEGAWMTKNKDRYYLQYAAPGTEFNIYGDGVYEADSPLGPYFYAENNPYSFKPGGFVNGAGHGSTFEDNHSNLWHISTMSISVKHMFERRLGVWPAGFDNDGVLFCNTRFGDYPMTHPTKTWENPWEDTFSGWMLLNYNKPVSASSEDPAHPATQTVNECVRNYWIAGADDAQPTLAVDMEEACSVNAVQINFAEHGCQQHGLAVPPLKHQYILETSLDGDTWIALVDKSQNDEDVPHDYIEVAEAVSARFIRITILHMPAQGRAGLTGLRIFGNGAGEILDSTQITSAKLHADDKLTAAIQWKAVEGSTGYNVRWGFSPDKLYHDWLVYDQTGLDLGAINKGQATWVAVEAFNENGVAEISPAVLIQ